MKIGGTYLACVADTHPFYVDPFFLRMRIWMQALNFCGKEKTAF
jgi:hypothetical protein